MSLFRSALYDEQYMLTFSSHGDISDFVLILPELQYDQAFDLVTFSCKNGTEDDL